MGQYQKEAELQTKIVEWFRATHPEGIIFHTPNEACSRRWNLYANQGVLKGAPDLTVVLRGVVFFVECKTKRGKQTEEQVTFQERCETLGIGYHVVRSLELFVDVVSLYEKSL